MPIHINKKKTSISGQSGSRHIAFPIPHDRSKFSDTMPVKKSHTPQGVFDRQHIRTWT